MKLLMALCVFLLAGCGAWIPIGRIPADKEGALIIRCHSYKGIIRKESRWMIIVWVWSKSGTIPDNPGDLEIDADCAWRVERTEKTDHRSNHDGSDPAGADDR